MGTDGGAERKPVLLKAASAAVAYVAVMSAYVHFKHHDLTLRKFATTLVVTTIAAFIAAVWDKRSGGRWSWIRSFLTILALALAVIFLFLAVLQATNQFR